MANNMSFTVGDSRKFTWTRRIHVFRTGPDKPKDRPDPECVDLNLLIAPTSSSSVSAAMTNTRRRLIGWCLRRSTAPRWRSSAGPDWACSPTPSSARTPLPILIYRVSHRAQVLFISSTRLHQQTPVFWPYFISHYQVSYNIRPSGTYTSFIVQC